jgi:PadR family transcriptional regulator
MASRRSDRPDLLPGTLDMLILKTLLFGPRHGHGITTSIRQTTEDVLTVDHGSLYPALHRLQRDGLISARWEVPEGKSREYKCYRLTAAGRKHLVRQESKWDEIVRAISRVLNPATQE